MDRSKVTIDNWYLYLYFKRYAFSFSFFRLWNLEKISGKMHIFKNSWFWVLLHFSSIINVLTWTGQGVTAPLWYSSTYLTPILCLDLKSSKLRACSTCCTAGTCTASWPRRPYTVNWKIMWQLCAWWLELQDKLTTVC